MNKVGIARRDTFDGVGRHCRLVGLARHRRASSSPDEGRAKSRLIPVCASLIDLPPVAE